MKKIELKKLIREEIRKVVSESNPTSLTNSRLPLLEREDISMYDGFIVTDMKANKNYNYKARYIKGKSADYSYNAAKEALKKKVGHDKIYVGSIVILKGQWDNTKLETLELENPAGTAPVASNKYSKAASQLFANVDEILKHYMVDDEYDYDEFKFDIKQIQSQADLTNWYKNMRKELKLAYGSDSEPIKDITKESPAIAQKAGVTL